MPDPATCLNWSPAVAYALGALAATLAPRRVAWPVASTTTIGALLGALANGAVAFLGPRPGAPVPGFGASLVVLVLVTFLGWIVAGYARRSLQGEPGQRRFVVALLATLGSVASVVASTHLGGVIAAWVAGSLALHHLLTFYADREAAIVVAHKKFIASRLAEACLLGGAWLLHRDCGTLDFASLASHASGASPPSGPASIAATLISIGVLLKSAQLPLHGWLIQVMEAPTAVSALLHAGVVNLGGFVLMRLAPLIDASAPARGVLVVVGIATASLAGLVMLTRITIKVRLAWSTCSQMGLMVAECGLGLYDVALLHLVAHSLYKAHAFLDAGGIVRASLARAAATTANVPRRSVGPLPALGATLLVVSGTTHLLAAWDAAPGIPWLNAALLSLGLATLLAVPARDGLAIARAIGLVVIATLAYAALHAAAAALQPATSVPPSVALEVGAVLALLALYLLQSQVLRPGQGASAVLYEWVYAGLYLDERFTRITFRLWPPAMPARAGAR